ncbi:MAG: hypothetical protein WAM82_28765 [Thermoanaerobaculia bacterium]
MEAKEDTKFHEVNCASFLTRSKDNQIAAKTLRSALDKLLGMWSWKEGEGGEWYGPETRPGDELSSHMHFTETCFVQFMISWQPLLDAVAGLIWSFLLLSGMESQQRFTSMFSLVRFAEKNAWPDTYEKMREILVKGLKWYITDARVLRNQLVHNERFVAIVPRLNSPGTAIELKKIGDEDTHERFALEEYVSTLYKNYLLFAVGTAEAAEAIGGRLNTTILWKEQ